LWNNYPTKKEKKKGTLTYVGLVILVIRLSKEDLLVLLAVYNACKGSTKANVSMQTIAKKLKRFRLYIRIKKSLRKLANQGYIWIHSGRRANGGVTYGITKRGILILKREKLIN